MSDKRCRKCGGPLPEAATTGRLAAYCSVECWRMAELEVKRINRCLEALSAG
jgi:hypothetical protein